MNDRTTEPGDQDMDDVGKLIRYVGPREDIDPERL